MCRTVILARKFDEVPGGARGALGMLCAPACPDRLARAARGALSLGLLVLALPGPWALPASAESAAGAQEPTPGRAITIGLTQAIDMSHAPEPSNEAERLVFRQLYETLIRIDAAGCPQPGLAASWSSADSLLWIFRLRPEARFWDGSHIRATDVRESWARRRTRSDGTRVPWIAIRDLPPPPGPVPEAADTVLAVRITLPCGEVPSLFAHPSLAVTKEDPRGAWPMGSGVHRIASHQPQVLRLVPAETSGDSTPARTSSGIDSSSAAAFRPAELSFRIHLGADRRDLLDAGVDLIVVPERILLEYIDILPDYDQVPLPWNRVYALASPRLCSGAAGTASVPMPESMPESMPDSMPGPPAPDVTSALRRELSLRTIVSEADTAWISTFAGLFDPPCSVAPSSVVHSIPWVPSVGQIPGWMGPTTPHASPLPTGSRLPRIVSIEGDPDAARIAGRLAALMTWDPERIRTDYGPGLIALAERLRANGPRAAHPPGPAGPARIAPVSGVPEAWTRPPLTPGLPRDEFWRSLSRGDDVAYILAFDRSECIGPLPGCVHPLVAIRARLVTRHGLTGIDMDGDGTPRLDRIRWSDAEAGTR